MAVKPDTLSNQAFTRENSPPQIRYGNIPTTLASTHEPTTIAKPSLFVIDDARCTKSIGEAPVQTLDFEEIMKKNNPVTSSDISDFDDDFYGSDGYNDDDLDPDGFDIENIADPSSYGY